MKLIHYLENHDIVTVETLRIFAGVCSAYSLSWIFLKSGLSFFALSLLLIVIGGTANLYVITFNKFRMPVLAKNRAEFCQLAKKNPERRICMLDSMTKLRWLADRIYIWKSFYSIGDILVFIGVSMLFPLVLLIYWYAERKKQKRISLP